MRSVRSELLRLTRETCLLSKAYIIIMVQCYANFQKSFGRVGGSKRRWIVNNTFPDTERWGLDMKC